MKTKINFATSLLIIILIITGKSTLMASKINVSGPGKITGKIRCSSTDLPMENATVTLFSADDSTMVAGTISDKFGNFFISMLEQGDYYIEISEHGFEPQKIDDLSVKVRETKICLNEIILKPDLTSEKKCGKLFKIKF